jgi:hypothetical protein
MATLVLTTIGTIVGGPIGGAIGAVIGQGVDQRLLAPKGRRGPRLGDLTVQTSSYGSAIPKLFGSMRVAGTVIWATDLRESPETSGGGKGRAGGTSYSYSVSFAVALSGRPIIAVHRIWADGKLLRGSGEDWKSETKFRLYRGSEAQAVDPLIASAEGPGQTPAYRGMAYVVFEDLQLADFGNRIPSLSFEVEAESGPITIGAIAAELSAGAVSGDTDESVSGYAASGDSVRGALETLSILTRMPIVDDGSVLKIGGRAAEVIGERDLGATATGARRGRLDIERIAAGVLPDEVAISYYEPTRDYQAGLQRARRGGPGRRVDSIDLAAALSAEHAKAAAERQLGRTWAERVRATVSLPPRSLSLRAGELVRLPGRSETFRISRWTLEHMALELQLVASSGPTAAPQPASPGRTVPGMDQAAGTTLLELLDLPPLDDSAAGPRLWIAAAGTQAGWRKAQLLATLDGGASYRTIGQTAGKAVIGTTLGSLPPGEPALFDTTSTIEIELADPAAWLENRDDDALAAGANLAMLGEELMQFGVAVPIGEGRFRLGRMLRGRRGTEAAMYAHTAGERFVLVSASTLLPFEAPPSAIGTTVRILAAGVGDAEGVMGEALLTGRAMRPVAPVHLSAKRLSDGTIRIGWVRRSRAGWAWLDGTDAPVGEEAERYALTITPDIGAARTVETIVPGFEYATAAQAADGTTAATTSQVTVAQVGAFAASAPASRLFTI